MTTAGNDSWTAGYNATYNCEFTEPVAAVVIGVLAVVGVLGNSLVVYIVARHRDMRSVTNTYISNLAKTDICFFLFCAFPASIQLYNGGAWPLGDFLCRFSVYMQSVSVQATCGTLTAMTVDRCTVIFNPLKARTRRTKKSVWITISFIWITSFLMHLPVVMFFGVVVNPFTGDPVCTYLFDQASQYTIYTIYEVSVMYLIPLTIIVACNVCIAVRMFTMKLPAKLRKSPGGAMKMAANSTHDKSAEGDSNNVVAVGKRARANKTPGNQRTRVTLVVMTIVLFFAVCWGPVHGLRIYTLTHDNYDCGLVMKLTVFGLCLTYINSAVNPVLYAFLGKSYRDYALEILSCKQLRHLQSRYTSIRPSRKRGQNTTVTTLGQVNTCSSSV